MQQYNHKQIHKDRHKDTVTNSQQITVSIRQQIQQQDNQQQNYQQQYQPPCTEEVNRSGSVYDQADNSNTDNGYRYRYGYGQQQQKQYQQQYPQQQSVLIQQLYTRVDQQINKQIVAIMQKQLDGLWNSAYVNASIYGQQQYTSCIFNILQQYNQSHQHHMHHMHTIQQQHKQQLQEQHRKHIQQTNNRQQYYTEQILEMDNKHHQHIECMQTNHKQHILRLQQQYKIQQIQLQQEYKRQQMQQQQQSSTKIKQIQSKLYNQQQRRSLQVNKINKQLYRYKSQISSNNTTIQQYAKKIGILQKKIQQYQLQLMYKDRVIDQIILQLNQAVQHSQHNIHTHSTKMHTISQQLQHSIQTNQQYTTRKHKINQQQQQIILALNNLCAYISAMKTEHDRQSPIKQLDQEEWEQGQGYGYNDGCNNDVTVGSCIQQLKIKQQQVIQHVNKLIKHTRSIKTTQHNLSIKYSQFLKQTEQKLQQYKNKIKQSQRNEKQYQAQIQSLSSTNNNNKMEINRLLDLLREGLEKDRLRTEETGQRILGLQRCVREKEGRIGQLEAIRKQQEQKFDKNINMLTIQIQSLKQSISTLKNVVKLKDQPQQQPLDSTIIQQMMDKTYQIRLQNAKLKDNITHLLQKQQNKSKEIHELEEKIRHLEEDRQKLRDVIKVYQGRVMECQGSIGGLQATIQAVNLQLCQVNQNLNNKYEQLVRYQQKILQKQKVIAQLQGKIHIYDQKQQTLHNQLSQKDHKHKQYQTKLQQINIQCKRLQIQLFQIHHAKHTQQKVQNIIFEERILNYQRLQMQKLQIYVLGQIIRTKKQEQFNRSIPMIQAEVQVCFSSNKEISQRNSPTTIRNCNKTKQRARRAQYQSIGKLVQVKNNKNNTQNQGQCIKQADNQNKNEMTLQNLNKTCKLRSMPQQVQGQKQKQVKSQVEQMNDIINYMVNYLKGYTRNGIRAHSWLTSQGEQYLSKIQNPNNIRQKYGTFQKVRSLIEKNQACRQLIKDYEKIANYYFNLNNRLEDMPSIGIWQSFDKQNIYHNTQSSKNMSKVLDSVHLRSR